MEFLALIPFVLDAVFGLAYQEMREMPEDTSAAWQCIESVCIDTNSVQRVDNLVYLTAKQEGETDQMFITLDCRKKAAAVTQGRYRVKTLPDKVMEYCRRS